MLKTIAPDTAEYIFDQLPQPVQDLFTAKANYFCKLRSKLFIEAIKIVDGRCHNRRKGHYLENGGRSEQWTEFIKSYNLDEDTLFAIEKVMRMIGWHDSWKELTSMMFVKERWYHLKVKHPINSLIVVKTNSEPLEYATFERDALLLYDNGIALTKLSQPKTIEGNASYFFVCDINSFSELTRFCHEKKLILMVK